MNDVSFEMITVSEAIRLAKEIGGKDGLNCIAELDETAVAGSREYAGNEQNLPLFGIPVLVKDNIDVKGFHTTAGSLALADNLAKSDAPVIQNLRRSGAVIIGKSNMTEFANYVSTKMPGGYSSRGGQVIHAVKPDLDPLGSSTGSAVAVAAGIVPMAVGTDTCHSVTACAMGNGICGLKPPAGTLSQEGIIPISKTFDSAGAMAQNVSDTLKLYSAMRDEPLPEIKPTPVGELRIAVNTANSDMDPKERRRFLDKLVKTLRNNGAVIREVNDPPTPELPAIMKREFGPGLEEYLGKSVAKLKTLKEIIEYFDAHPDTMKKYGYDLLQGAFYDKSQEAFIEEEYQKAMRSRGNEIERITEEISDYDAVLITGPTYVNHLCGLPTITVAGRSLDANGVRQAVMLYGTDEYRLYAAALTVEQLLNSDDPAI
ncbi:MAG: amidase [Lachnospiraceae bacterium]|nr:amidase [Lachnospiraceae bacterium]